MFAGATAASATDYTITNVAVDPDAPYNTVDITGTIVGAYPRSVDATGQIAGLILLTTSGGQTLPVFCVDLFHDIGIGGYNPGLPYTTMPVTTDSADGQPGVGNPISATTAEEIQTLVNLGFSWYVKDTLTGNEATALQDAIWTIEYNTGGSTLTVTADHTIDALAAGYVTYADHFPASYSEGLYPGADGQGFGSGQGFVQGAPATPEAATITMMLMGFAGLGLAGRRHVRKAQAPLAA
jgi:hypothetical protein